MRKERSGKLKPNLVLLIILIIIIVGGILIIYFTGYGPQYKPGITKRSVEQYMNSYPSGSPYNIFPRGLLGYEILPGQEILNLNVPNPGFELDENNDGMPDGWGYNGKMKYSSSNCFKGKRCLYVDVDDSDYGWFQMNSDEIDVMPGKIYNALFNINCIKCENNSAYMAVFWMKYDLNSGDLVEFHRNILVFNNTQGYEPFNLIAMAPQEAEKAIFGVRVHLEAGVVQPRTRLYIDGS